MMWLILIANVRIKKMKQNNYVFYPKGLLMTSKDLIVSYNYADISYSIFYPV